MKKVIANFKMNKTPSESKRYLMNLVTHFNKDSVQLTLCLPYTSLPEARYLLSGSNILLGAQNVSDVEQGGCTGEISGAMLKDLGVSTVLIGHAERRSKFKENNKLINSKIKVALKNGLGVILCVGETLAEKNTLKTMDTLRDQIEEGLKGLYENELEKVTIAYDPIWAIGNGKNATVKEIEYAVKVIRKVIEDDFSSKASKSVSVVYGGSITAKNVSSLMHAKGVDGALIGGACLDENVFLNIISQI